MGEIAKGGVALVAFAWLAFLYLFMAIAASFAGDRFADRVDHREQDGEKTLRRILLEFLVYVWYLSIVVYVAEIVVNKIPYPLDGVAGFAYASVRDKGTFPLFAAMLMAFGNSWQVKTKHLFERLESRKRLSWAHSS